MILPRYNLKSILRCHSLKSEPEDDYSQIWDIKFEPDINDMEKTTDRCAVVGQEYLSIINCGNKSVEMKFKCPPRNEKDEELYTLSWSTVQYKENLTQYTNILAIAGKLRSVYLIQPSQQSWYENLRGHKSPIKSVVFHPTRHTWLFSGDMGGNIFMWDVAVPTIFRPRLKSRKMGDFKTPEEDILQISISPTTDTMLVSTQNGLYIWTLVDEKRPFTSNSAASRVILPFSFEEIHNEPMTEIVDSICLVSKELIACKSPLDRNIYVWDLLSLTSLKSPLDHSVAPPDRVKPQIVAILPGPETKECYMKMASSYNNKVVSPCKSTILAAGDDVGNIWVYEVSELVKRYATNSEDAESGAPLAPPRTYGSPMRITAFQVASWPEDVDMLSSDAKTNIPHPKWQILSKIVNCVGISADLRYMIGGMNCNLITVWDKDEDNSEEF